MQMHIEQFSRCKDLNEELYYLELVERTRLVRLLVEGSLITCAVYGFFPSHIKLNYKSIKNTDATQYYYSNMLEL